MADAKQTPWPFPTSWKQVYDQIERLVTPPMQTWLGTDSANRTLGLVREQMLSHERLQREWIEGAWRTLRLPSKADLTSVAGQIVHLEDRLEGLQDLLEDAPGGRQAPVSVDPMALDALLNRVDEISQRLGTLDAAVAELVKASQDK